MDGERPIVLLLHGPNLNLLGDREPEIYGTATLADHVATAERVAGEHGLAVEAFQSNHEGELVDAIHGARRRCAAIIINPGAFTHYAWSLHDALAAFDGPVVELHLSNPNAREPGATPASSPRSPTARSSASAASATSSPPAPSPTCWRQPGMTELAADRLRHAARRRARRASTAPRCSSRRRRTSAG